MGGDNNEIHSLCGLAERKETLVGEKSATLKALGVPSSADAHALLARKRELDATRKGVLAQLRAFKVDEDPATAIASTSSHRSSKASMRRQKDLMP